MRAVVADGDAAEQPLHEIAVFVYLEVDQPLAFGGRIGRDHRSGALEGQLLAQLQRIKRRVRDQAAFGRQGSCQFLGSPPVSEKLPPG